MRARVVTPLGAEVGAAGDVWDVEEGAEYRVVAAGADGATFGGDPLKRDAAGFILTLSFWTGRAEVLVLRGEDREVVSLSVRSPKHKLVAVEWEALLDDIDRRWPGCTLGFEGGRHGQVRDEGLERLLALLAFLPLLDELLRDVASLLDGLRTREVFPVRHVPLRSVRRVDATTARWIATHPHAAVAVRPSAHREVAAERLFVAHRRREVSWDHPANRALRWLLERLAGRLTCVAGLLRAQAERLHDSLTDARAWCSSRAARLDQAADRLDGLVRRGALADLAAAPPDAAALLTFTNDPLYAKVYRRCRRWLAPRLDRVQGADVPIRASFDLYERWCLLALRQALGDAFPEATWQDEVTTALDVTEESGGTAAVGRCAQGTITLYDNLVFPAWPSTRGQFSVSTERRPDFLVSWSGHDGTRRWVILDAKYRATRASIAPALEELHVYRDALRWPELGGACHAAALLVPTVATDAERWADEGFIERFRFGCITLRPKQTASSLVRWLREWLPAPAPTDAAEDRAGM